MEERPENIYSVKKLNEYISGLIQEEPALRRLTVEGEVSNVKYHTSGHVYFTLKDEASQIAAVMWRSAKVKGLTFNMANGDRVIVRGQLEVYAAQGKYQVVAHSITKAGAGELNARFEALKKELMEMGMFDSMYKKPIPKYPKRVGIITAETGAAVRDIIQTAKRRNPYVELVLYPAIVQGQEAIESVARGIEYMDEQGFDVLIVGRGGGPLEDLWAFNEERVARAIFQAKTPIISGVGHETDTSISDFVADLRAETPTAAAVLAVPLYSELEERILSDRKNLNHLILERIQDKKKDAKILEGKLRLQSPENAINVKRQRALSIEERIESLMNQSLREARMRLNPMEGVLRNSFDRTFQATKNRLNLCATRLDGLSPLKKFEAGYAYPSDADGKTIRSISEVRTGQTVRIRLKDGRFDATVTETEETNYG